MQIRLKLNFILYFLNTIRLTMRFLLFPPLYLFLTVLVSCQQYSTLLLHAKYDSQGQQGTEPSGQRKIKYFGYYASQMDGIGVDEDFELLSQSSNLVFISSGELEKKLALTRKYKMKAIVDIHFYFFDTNFKLRPDYSTYFAQFENILNAYQDVIVAYYVLDEPYILAEAHGISRDQMKANIELVANYLKSKYPAINLAIIFDATTIKREWALPENIDWYGFDCYENFYYCGGGLRSIPTFFGLLEKQVIAFNKKDSKNRQIIAVPPSAYNTKWADREQRVLDQIELYKQYIDQDPLVQIIMPFTFQTFTEGDHQWVGPKDVPTVLRKFQSYYHEVID